VNKQELKGTLDSHSKWLRSEEDGMRANLKDADLSRANLSGADLSDADLKGADLRGAYLRGAYLRCADLCGTNLRCADLKDADLRGADLRGAYLSRANLWGADLRCADLSTADLSRATYISQWQAPQGVRRTCYSVKHDKCVMHKLGCFWGTTEQAIKAIRKKYGNDSMYEQLLVLNAKALTD
jgi:uncharacterized protein YjbI with pentapeptide repeats